MKLVEDDEADAVERGIALEASRENALGDDFDARVRADARVAAHPVADRLADALAAKLGDPIRRGARGEPARLEHHDRSRAEPRAVEQGERNERGLACAWRSLKDQRAVVRERLPDRGEDARDRQCQDLTMIRNLDGSQNRSGWSMRRPPEILPSRAENGDAYIGFWRVKIV